MTIDPVRTPDPRDEHRRRIYSYAESVLAAFLTQWFAGQSQRVLGRLFAAERIRVGLWETLLPASETTMMRLAFERVLANVSRMVLDVEIAPARPRVIILTRAAGAQIQTIGQPPDLLRVIADGVAKAGRTISHINTVTRNAIRDQLRLARQRGYDIRQIAYGVVEDAYRGIVATVAEVYRGRAITIAQTTLVHWINVGATIIYEAMGYDKIRVTDGVYWEGGCDWFRHRMADGDLADGKIVTPDYARATPLAHPRCKRRFWPYDGPVSVGDRVDTLGAIGDQPANELLRPPSDPRLPGEPLGPYHPENPNPVRPRVIVFTRNGPDGTQIQ